MKKKEIDYSLYFVTDRGLSLGRTHLEIIEAAVEGGVTLVQLREKDLDSRRFYEEALAIKKFLDVRRIPLIINDRIDIAMAVDAEGVHLGQEDLPITIARKLLGPEKVIGISVFTPEEAREAERMGADYLGLSPIFLTGTKPELIRQIGFEGISPIRRVTKVPLVGIGSMNEMTVFEAICRGLDGAAVVSAICAKEDVCTAARMLKGEIKRARMRGGVKNED